MRILEPASKDAMRLLMQGSYALSIMEGNGMPVCPIALEESSKEISEQIRTLEATLRDSDLYLAQRRRYGKNCSIGSREQLAVILYDEMGMEGAKRSHKTGRYVMDDATLEDLALRSNLPYLTIYRKLNKLYKLKSTYIDGLRRELVNGRVHGGFNLHNVTTYRGSADTPNLNNLPSRDKIASKYIKGVVRPEEGWVIVERDFKALEVYISCNYHKDRTLIRYLETDYDMHSEVASECLKLPKTYQNFKEVRQMAKGYFTFAALYGDHYSSMAGNLWHGAHKLGLGEHLASQGFKALGIQKDPKTNETTETHGPEFFVSHIREQESDFWNRRFAEYNQWRKEWYAAYMRKGYFSLLTGFIVHGVRKRNEVINCPIQGTAFHCLLQSIIDIQKEITRRGMRTRLICEIHDSLIAEVPKEELDEYLEISEYCMSEGLSRRWDWINVPLVSEVEVGEHSWHEKVSLEKYLRSS